MRDPVYCENLVATAGGDQPNKKAPQWGVIA